MVKSFQSPVSVPESAAPDVKEAIRSIAERIDFLYRKTAAIVGPVDEAPDKLTKTLSSVLSSGVTESPSGDITVSTTDAIVIHRTAASGNRTVNVGSIDGQMLWIQKTGTDPLYIASARHLSAEGGGIVLFDGDTALFFWDDNNNKWHGSKQTSHIAIQSVYRATREFITITSTIPFDDTIPQITEGDEIGDLTVIIEPSDPNNFIELEVNIAVSGVNSSERTIALFRNSGSDAIVASCSTLNPNDLETVGLIYRERAGTTSKIRYTVRVGADSGNAYVNGQGGSRKLGGVMMSCMIAREVPPTIVPG